MIELVTVMMARMGGNGASTLSSLVIGWDFSGGGGSLMTGTHRVTWGGLYSPEDTIRILRKQPGDADFSVVAAQVPIDAGELIVETDFVYGKGAGSVPVTFSYRVEVEGAVSTDPPHSISVDFETTVSPS